MRADVRPNLVFIDVSAESGLTTDPPALVTRIAGKLLGGQISGTLEAQARAAVERVPANLGGLRIAEALYLISTSPEYAAQR